MAVFISIEPQGQFFSFLSYLIAFT